MFDRMLIHNHDYDPSCREIYVDGRLVGTCLALLGQGGNDLGAPQSAPADRSATGGAEGSQISDPVSSPEHYRKFPIEVIEITERLGFCLGNVIKYTLRCDYKGKPLEDLRKARWYLDREIARREAEATD